MWVITVYGEDHATIMYEFEKEEEARNAFKNKQGCKILTEIVYVNENWLALTVFQKNATSLI